MSSTRSEDGAGGSNPALSGHFLDDDHVHSDSLAPGGSTAHNKHQCPDEAFIDLLQSKMSISERQQLEMACCPSKEKQGGSQLSRESPEGEGSSSKESSPSEDMSSHSTGGTCSKEPSPDRDSPSAGEKSKASETGPMDHAKRVQGLSPTAFATSNTPSNTRVMCVAARSKQKRSVGCQTEDEESCSRTTATDQSATSSNSNEGVLRLMIQNFPNMNDTVRGPPKRINGVHWRIMVMPRQHVVQKKGTQKCLGFFLQCCPDAYSDSWSCLAAAELRLISQKPGVPHFTRKTNHTYTAKENDWGYSCFMTWADILDENQGYIKDDRVVLEVSVKADVPKNILSHDEFRKRIQSWFDLADMQFKRGMIDLAIEANAQALKFCKDRDAECKEKLEKQRMFFVEKKVVESIQRIENKGKDPTAKPEEDATVQQNALRLALTQQTQKAASKKVNGKKERKNRAATPPGNPPGKQHGDVNSAIQGNETENEHLVGGRFNKDTMCAVNMCSTPWARKGDEAFNLDDSSLDKIYEPNEDKDTLVMRYVNDQFKNLNVSHKETVANSQPKIFRYTPMDAEIQRQFIIKNAISSVEEFVKKMELEGSPLLSVECEEIPEMELSNLWAEGVEEAYARRLSIIDREAHFIDAKIRLFWRFLRDLILRYHNVQEDGNVDAMSLLGLDDDMSYTDNGSHCSTDSDSASGEGPRMKRSRCDNDCDNCLSYRMNQLTNMKNAVMAVDCDHEFVECKIDELGRRVVDFQCQTELPMSDETIVVDEHVKKQDTESIRRALTNPPLPSVRMQKRPTVKAVSKKGLKQQIAQTQRLDDSKRDIDRSSSDNCRPLADLLEGNQFIEGMGVPVAIPPYLPMEFAMKCHKGKSGAALGDNITQQLAECQKNFQMDSQMEEYMRAMMGKVWTMIRNGDGKQYRGPATVVPPLVPNPSGMEGIFGSLPAEIHPQQVMAALSVIAVNCSNAKKVGDKLRDLINDIDKKSRTKDMRSALQQLCKLGDMVMIEDDEDHVNSMSEDRKGNGEDYMLSKHIVRLDSLLQKAAKYTHYVHVKDSERLLKAISSVEAKVQNLEKEKVMLHKVIEDLKKDMEKHEKMHNKTQADFRNEREQKERANAQLKEKNKEAKKAEKRIKDLTNALEEKDEMKEKADNLQKELQLLQKRVQEESNKLKREQQNKDEMKRHMQQELNNRDMDVARLSQTIDDRHATIKKLENQLNAEKRNNHASLVTQTERAKKGEIMYLEVVLDAGIKQLEAFVEEHIKLAKEMAAAASEKERSASEQQLYNTVRNECSAKCEEVKRVIQKTRQEFHNHIEAVKNGKSLSQLGKITVCVPPTAVKVPVVSPIIRQQPPPPIAHRQIIQQTNIPPPSVSQPPPEIKPTPGVIGSRSSSSLPAPIGSSISPKSKAPGSPIQKPVAAVASQPQVSQMPQVSQTSSQPQTIRHPGAIGTRVNNGVVENVQPNTTNSDLNNINIGGRWHWSGDYNFLPESLLPGNRSLNSLSDFPSATASTSSLNTTLLSNPVNNGWNDDTWKNGNTTSTATNHVYMASGLGSTQLPPPPTHYAPPSSTGWDERRPTMQQQPPPALPPTQQQQASKYAVIIDRLTENFRNVSHKRLVELSNDYCTTYKTNLSGIGIENAVQMLSNHIAMKLKNDMEMGQRRMMASPQVQVPPGSAPGYMGMGLLGVDSRSTNQQMYNSILDQPLLNGDAPRNVLGATDKWSI